MKEHRIRNNLIKIIPVIGSIVIAIGVFLPWISFLAGIQTFTGFAGLNGKILLFSSLVSLFLSIFFLRKKTSKLQWLLGGVGFIQLSFCSYLMVNVIKIYQQLTQSAMSGMTAPGVGIGIFVTELGSLLVFSIFFLRSKSL